MNFRRRMREWPDLVEDRRTPFMVGRMVGACEMSARLLDEHDDPTAAHIGSVLGGIVGYFFDDDIPAAGVERPPAGDTARQDQGTT